MKCKDDQTVGDAVYGLISEWNVVVDEISVKTNESDADTTCSTPPDTPVSVLKGFGTKFLTVTIRSKDVGKETDDSSGSKAKNALSILMNINKSYTELPEKRYPSKKK
ncbi:uncharacterized protein LOC134282378 [Saccostrea cucullata]|uniref:uncharacterized protein LOC134282378 n=1 Tax=Saccostrea cuccullata TaxID=36930 RepID=UPI002ED60DB9